MDNSLSTPVQQNERCNSCSYEVANDDVYCTNCGYPLKGTEQEQNDFLFKREMAQLDLNGFNDQLRKAANTLYYAAGIFVLYGIIWGVMQHDDPDAMGVIITNLVLAGIFVALGAYTHKKPLVCLIAGLSLYVIVQILLLIVSPVTVVRGIIAKIIVIGLLIKGIQSALAIEKIKKEHNIA